MCVGLSYMSEPLMILICCECNWIMPTTTTMATQHRKSQCRDVSVKWEKWSFWWRLSRLLFPRHCALLDNAKYTTTMCCTFRNICSFAYICCITWIIELDNDLLYTESVMLLFKFSLLYFLTIFFSRKPDNKWRNSKDIHCKLVPSAFRRSVY